MEELFGYLYVGNGYEYHLFFDKEGEIILRNCQTKLIEDTNFDALGYYLANPWDQIRYYVDEEGNHHWYSIVYDWVKIDVWGKDIENMMFNVAAVFKGCIDFFMDKEEKLDKKF